MSEEEAKSLRDRILNKPQEAREEFFLAVMSGDEFGAAGLPYQSMQPFRGIVNSILRSKSAKDTADNRRKAAQKIYEIIRYDLEDPHLKIRLDSHFWEDVETEVKARYDGWMTEENGRTIIEGFISRKSIDGFVSLIKDACKQRLKSILPCTDVNRVNDMTSFVILKYMDNNFSLLRSIQRPGTIKRHVAQTVKTSFLKTTKALITEPFHHQNGVNCGYAHLSLIINENKLKELYGNDWYILKLQQPFRESVESRYEPYGEKPSYRDVAEKNRSIEKDLNVLFTRLEWQAGLGKGFPAKEPCVSYNKTMEQFYEIKVCYSDGWSMLSDSGSTDSSHEPEPGSTIDSNGEDSLIIRHFYRVLSRNTIPLEPWQIGMLISKEHYSSKEIGYELYKRGKISKEVLDGFPPESEEGKTRLEKRVNKLTQTIKDNFKRAIQIGDFDEDEYRVIFKYLENHNNWIR